MKKFSDINEAVGRVHDKGNPFSNGHRSRVKKDGFLMNYHYMIDIDEIIYDKSGKIIALVEEKYQPDYKMGSSKTVNILEDYTIQKDFLLYLCDILQCKLFVRIKRDNLYYRILNDNKSKEYSGELFEESKKKYLSYNSDNMIYIEFRKLYSSYKITAVVKRLEDNINVNLILSELVSKLNVPLVKVGDSGDTIKFYKSSGPGGEFVDEVESILYPKIITDEHRIEIEDKWEEIYRKLGIWE